MVKYIIKRLLYSVLTVLLAVTLVFVLQRTAGDPVRLMLPQDMWTDANFALVREQLGLDKPILTQYFDFIAGIFRGDLGYSYRQSLPALQLVLERVPATMRLGVAGMLVAMLIGIPIGVLAALKRNTAADKALMSVALLGQSMPSYWLGIMMMLLFSVQLRWLPTLSDGGIKSLIMPAFTLGLYSAARIARMTRSSMLEVISMDYVRTAKGKGLMKRTVIMKHAFRNALIPIVSILGMEFGGLIGGSVIVETVFAWPGIGRLSVDALNGRDFPVVQAVIIIVCVSFVIVNLGVDLLYGYLDPRIKVGAKKQG